MAAQTPASTTGPGARGTEALNDEAAAHLAAGRVEAALASLRESLKRNPDDHNARLRLAGILLDRQRYAEALPELRRVLASRPDVAAYAAWLRALDAVGAPLERALAAEEAVRRHPGHLPFVWAAIEALVTVGAHEQALGYWRRLPKAEQGTPRGQYLLGAAHEAAGRLREALNAYRAAKDEPRAQSALVRLRGKALALDGARYFPPGGWTPLPGQPPRIADMRAGMTATLHWQGRVKPQEALRQVLGQRLPLPADFSLEPLLAGKRKPSKETSPLDLFTGERLACSGARPMLCVELGPGKVLAGLFPRVHAGAVDLGAGTLVVLLEGAERAAAPSVLGALGDAPLLTEGGRP